MIGGTRRWVMLGWRPTVCSAISSASSRVVAALKPSRWTTSRSPPTTMMSPAYSIAKAAQYHAQNGWAPWYAFDFRYSCRNHGSSATRTSYFDSLERRGSDVSHLLHRQEHRLVPGRPVGHTLLHEGCDRRKRMVVHCRLDVKHAHRVLDQLTLPDARMVQSRVGGIHVRPRVEQRLDVVMGADAAVRREARGHRLVAAVHRHQRQVHVDHQVGLGGALVQRHLLALRGLADVHVLVRVFAVVLVELVRPEGRGDSFGGGAA